MKIPRYPGCVPKSPEVISDPNFLPGASSWAGACSAGQASSAIVHQHRQATATGCSAGTQSKDA